MLGKRGSIVEARLAFVADMVETKTNEENGEVEAISRTVDCFQETNETNSENLTCVQKTDDTSEIFQIDSQRFDCIQNQESQELSTRFFQIANEINLNYDFQNSLEEQKLPNVDFQIENKSTDESENLEIHSIETQVPDFITPKSECSCKESQEKKKEEILQDIERERRRIIDKQVVRRKKIETWAVNDEDCIDQDSTIVQINDMTPSLQSSLKKYIERKQQQSSDSSHAFIVVPTDDSPIVVTDLVDFGSILERKQELKHFWEQKMMDVITPDAEEIRIPPVVVNSHCKLKSNGVITKCQETGVMEPEMDRRPSPEGEESREIPCEHLDDSLESQLSSLSNEEFQKTVQEDSNDFQKMNGTCEHPVEDSLEKESIKPEEICETEMCIPVLKITNEDEIVDEPVVIGVEEKKDTEINEISDDIELNNGEVLCESKDLPCSTNDESVTDEIESPKDTVELKENETKEISKEEKIEENTFVEGVLDREIRLQQEREELLAKEREIALTQPSIQNESPEETFKPQIIGEKFHNHIQSTERPYCSHTTESRIALEIREMREREEELRQMRENVHSENKCSEPQPLQPTMEKCVSKKTEVQSLPVGVFRKKRDQVTVRPLTDMEDEDDKPIYRMTKESPIEKEIRLATEREEELKRQKGTLTSPKKETPPKMMKERSLSLTTPVIGKGDTQRLLATNRIQQEIEEQTKRELDLRETGHIRTISQDTSGRPPVCKNLGMGVNVRKYFSNQNKGTVTNDEDAESKVPPVKKDKVDARFPLASRRNVSAETKIQQELMEMKAREEELRQQRSKVLGEKLDFVNGCNEADHNNNNNNINEKDENRNEVQINNNTKRRRSALIDQWEQRIQSAEGKS